MGRVALVAAAVMAAGIMWPPIAHGQDPSLMCGWELATAGGQALRCPLGGLQNFSDFEGGTEHYVNGVLDKPKLDLNISSGEAIDDNTGQLVRSRLNLNPDVGGPGTVIFDGRRGRIASFYPGGIEFFAPVVFHDGVGSVANGTPDQLVRLRKRLVRLERRVRRLRTVLRRVYTRTP